MATATSPTTPKFVQQAFNWDGLETAIAKSQTQETKVIPQSRPPRSGSPLTVPTFTTSTSARRGRCEHVGGILASVLERYGIGVDELLAEIDGLK